jgi:Putative Actinobacterial Holin-X, holin superfamily III
MGAWLELFRSLGQALLELVRAELATIGDELATSGRRLGGALALLAAAAALAFWTVAVLVYTLIQVLALWLPLWGASATVAGLCVAVVAGLAAVGVARLKRLEGPARTLGRHLRDHQEWWNDRLLGGDDEESE